MLKYIEEKIWLIIFYATFLVLLSLFFALTGAGASLIILFDFLLVLIFLIYISLEYYYKKKKQREIIKIVDECEEKYLLPSILKKPHTLDAEAYYYALKTAGRAMNDKITEVTNLYNDYEDYIEGFVHEIKTPLSALSLYADNNNIEIKGEIKKIDNLLEQVLFYARSENTEKDYFVKEIFLADLVHSLLLEYKDYFLNKGIKLNVHNLEVNVYTDEKWLKFILGQLLQNALKYMNKDVKVIEIYAYNENNKVILCLKDNGKGIKDSELPRIFEKGFTGLDRKKEYSTGLGLYLCKKLCDRLNLNIKATSTYNEFTEFKIIFPKTKIFNRR